MTNILKETNSHSHLRQKAEASLRGGVAPATHGWTIGAASLTLLHQLASNPATASDTLKLLHELQVHQVELDVQQEHMNEERHAMEQSALRLADLYVSAPIAYFMVNSAGQIAEGNSLGARMMGRERNDLHNHNITDLADLGSHAAVLALLEQVRSSGLRHSCRIQALDTKTVRWLDMVASASPGGQHCLVVVMDVASDPAPVLQA